LISGYESVKINMGDIRGRTGKGRCMGRTGNAVLSMITGINHRRRPPWLNFELEFGQPGGRDEMVVEGENGAGHRGLNRWGGKLFRQDINKTSNGVVNAPGEIVGVI
jgi:hypothetical protein